MAVKVLIERTALNGHEDTLAEMIRRVRAEAVRQKGYMYGETWRSVDNPRMIMVLSVWGTREHWEAWQLSDVRHALEKRMYEWQNGPPVVRVYQDYVF
jgi:heme-degrading monooxygenase HmoA